MLLICEIHRKYCNVTLKWLCFSELSDSLSADGRYQLCLAEFSLASREHPCDTAAQDRSDCWASSEAVNCKRGELSAGKGAVKKFATTLERRTQRNGPCFSSAIVKAGFLYIGSWLHFWASFTKHPPTLM